MYEEALTFVGLCDDGGQELTIAQSMKWMNVLELNLDSLCTIEKRFME